MLTGMELIADINDCELKKGQSALWWLGQHSFIIKLGATIIYVDPFLSPHESRLVPSLLEPQQITHADLVLGSHDHTDHIDRDIWPALAAASPQAKFIVPELLRQQLSNELQIPIKRLVGLDDNQTCQCGDLQITGIASAHEFLDRDGDTGHFPYLGYVLESNGCCIYHSGDCCIYEGLRAKLKRWSFDVVMLPINGRDAKRLASGCIGNMTYQEAADLAGTLQPKLTIPAHYDMFAMNREDPSLFADYMRVKYPHLETHICQYGERLVTGENEPQVS